MSIPLRILLRTMVEEINTGSIDKAYKRLEHFDFRQQLSTLSKV